MKSATSCRPSRHWNLVLVAAFAAGLASSLGVGCGTRVLPPPSPPPIGLAKAPDAPGIQIPQVRFTDITDKAGIRFRHTNGSFGKKLLPETMGSGVAFLDYDNDGHQDLLFVNSCSWPGYEDKQQPTP